MNRLQAVRIAVREYLGQLESLPDPTMRQMDLMVELSAALADLEEAERDGDGRRWPGRIDKPV